MVSLQHNVHFNQEYEDDNIPDVDFCITTPVNYQPRQPPILNEYEKRLVLCLLNDYKERIIASMQFMRSEHLVDLLPAFSAFKLRLIPRKSFTLSQVRFKPNLNLTFTRLIAYFSIVL